MTEPRNFAALLTQFRRAAGLSGNALAKRTGVDPAYTHRMEHGKVARPSREILENLITVLELSPFEADELRLAAGYCPLVVSQLSSARFRALHEFLSQS